MKIKTTAFGHMSCAGKGVPGMSVICILIVASVFFGDLWIKNRIEKYISAKGGEKERELAGGKLLIRRHHNRGLMLNLGEKKSSLVAALSLSLTAVLTLVFIVSLGRKGSGLLRVGLALLLGGAFSNTYDRLKRKYVVDYLSFPVKWKRLRSIVFNISDFCIMIGALLCVLGAAE